MKLLEFADVNPQDGKRWEQGYNESARECAVTVQLTQICVDDPDTPDTITVIDGTGDLSQYFVAPFAAETVLKLSVMCARDDDEKWLERALEAAREQILGRALVIQVATDADTYIGHAGVQSEAIAGNTAANWRAAIIASRRKWVTSVVDPDKKTPALHVPPSVLDLVKDSGVVNSLGEGDFETIWGDPVVVSEGYDRTTSNAFWTGSIKVRWRAVEGLGPHRISQQNDVQYQANEVYSVDVNPCTIVRIGTYTA
jgi:hypothetical protein